MHDIAHRTDPGEWVDHEFIPTVQVTAFGVFEWILQAERLPGNIGEPVVHGLVNDHAAVVISHKLQRADLAGHDVTVPESDPDNGAFRREAEAMIVQLDLVVLL